MIGYHRRAGDHESNERVEAATCYGSQSLNGCDPDGAGGRIRIDSKARAKIEERGGANTVTRRELRVYRLRFLWECVGRR